MLGLLLATSLHLTLDVHGDADPIHAKRSVYINFEVTLHRPPSTDAQPPEADFENHQPHYFDQRPGPNVELHAVRIDGTKRIEVPIRVISSGSAGRDDREWQELSIIIPSADREARLSKMVECIGVKGAEGIRSYVERYIVDNEPGTYEITASYHATTWPRATPPIVSPPLRIIVEDGVDGYQLFCDALRKGR
jgi:hypothetical protein